MVNKYWILPVNTWEYLIPMVVLHLPVLTAPALSSTFINTLDTNWPEQQLPNTKRAAQ